MRSEGVAPGAGPLEWPMPRKFIWVWVLIVVVTWWWIPAARQAPSAGPVPAVVLVALAVAGRMVAILVETAWYVAVWRSLGRRLPFVWFAVWLVSLTLIDFFGGVLHSMGTSHPALAPWLAPLVGMGLHPSAHQWGPGLRVMSGSLGLFTLARIAFAAVLQARATGASRVLALMLTAGTWLVTRIVLWWTADLVRGMSPLP